MRIVRTCARENIKTLRAGKRGFKI